MSEKAPISASPRPTAKKAKAPAAPTLGAAIRANFKLVVLAALFLMVLVAGIAFRPELDAVLQRTSEIDVPGGLKLTIRPPSPQELVDSDVIDALSKLNQTDVAEFIRLGPNNWTTRVGHFPPAVDAWHQDLVRAGLYRRNVAVEPDPRGGSMEMELLSPTDVGKKAFDYLRIVLSETVQLGH